MKQQKTAFLTRLFAGNAVLGWENKKRTAGENRSFCF